MQEVKIKGYVNTTGYRIVADEKIDPGKYGFKLVHESEKAHYFSSEEQSVIREWMKALMKSSIDRDYSSARSLFLSLFAFARCISWVLRLLFILTLFLLSLVIATRTHASSYSQNPWYPPSTSPRFPSKSPKP